MNLKRLICLYAVLCFCSPCSLWGQQNSYRYGQELLEEGETLDYFFKHREALPLFRQAADCFSELDSVRLESYAFSCIGNMQIELGAFDLAKEEFSKALLLAQKGDFRLETISAKEGLAKLMTINGDGVNALVLFKKMVAERTSLQGKFDLDLAIPINYIGGIYGNRGDFELAATYFAKSLEIKIRNLGPDNKKLASSYYNLANCLLLQGDLEEAMQQMYKALYVVKKHHKGDNIYLFSIYNGLGAVYLELYQFEKAEEYLNKADEIGKKILGVDNLRRQLVLINLAKLAKGRGQLELAIKLLNERLALQQKHLPLPNMYTIITLQALGRYHIEAEMPEKGLDFFKKAKALVEQDQSGRTKDQNGSLYLDLGNVYLHTKEYKQALHYYQKALSHLSWGKELGENDLNNPSLKKIVKWPLVLEILYSKASTLVAIAKDDHQHPYHQLALETLLHAAELIDQMRVRLKTASAQESLSQRGRSIYQSIISLAYQRYQIDQSTETLELAFWAAEKNKAFLLLRNTQKLDLNLQQILPDSLFALEASLKADISHFETKLYQVRQEVQDSSFRELQNELFAQRQSYEALTQYLEKEYPRYFYAQYPTQRVTIKEIQTRLKLATQTAWIEYAWGDSLLFTFVITPERSKMLALSTTASLTKEISELSENLANEIDLATDSYQQLLQFKRQSHQIFEQIVEPLYDFFDPQTSKLIIIPDRELFQLPFELLLSEPADSARSYKDLPYLLHQYQIQYDASATIWNLQMQRSAQAHNQKSLIFAYEGIKDALNTDQEAEIIQEMLNASVYSGPLASKDQFRELAPKYGLLHLACHAQLNDVDPKFSALYLAPPFQDSLQAGRLYIQELFHMELRAELAVLSACETGKGKYIAGEGQMSLTYGFLTAGVPAVVMSLWQVEDHSTQKLMEYFYQNLAQGLAKDEALRNAKIQYLKLADPLTAHPRFWAAFVAQGNMEPVSFLATPSGIDNILNKWSFWLLIGLMLGVLAIYLGKRARNAKFSGIPE